MGFADKLSPCCWAACVLQLVSHHDNSTSVLHGAIQCSSPSRAYLELRHFRSGGLEYLIASKLDDSFIDDNFTRMLYGVNQCSSPSRTNPRAAVHPFCGLREADAVEAELHR